VDRENKNYHNCGGFRYLARNCRNKRTEERIGWKRRLEYKNWNNRERRMIEEVNGQNDRQNNLNGDKDLIVLN